MSDIEVLRNLDLAGILVTYNILQDKDDKKQFKSDKHRISVTNNGFGWYDHDHKKGGGGGIDLIAHLEQIDFNAALRKIKEMQGIIVTCNKEKVICNKEVQITPLPVPFPEKLPVVVKYLVETRKLKREIVEWCVSTGKLYADGYANCVFMYGKTGAELRGTGKKWRSSRGIKEHPFVLPKANANQLAVTESAIEAISLRQLRPNYITAAIGGNGNDKIMKKLAEVATERKLKLVSAFNNDTGGLLAHEKLCEIANYDVERIIPEGKDWNEKISSFPH